MAVRQLLLTQGSRAARTLIVLLLVVVLPSLAAAASLKGVALIVGNGDYEHLPKLANPPHDATAIGAMFKDLGFATQSTTDRDLRRLNRDLEDFSDDAQGADVAVLYYSGHGIEAGGDNFLVPVDADLSSLDDADARLVPLNAIVAELQKTVPIVIVLLDACRNDPFPAQSTIKRNAASAPVTISASGLAEARSVVPLALELDGGRENLGTVIGFAAAPGRPALDGDQGRNSPYAAAVLKHLDAMSGEEFGTVMRMIAEEVYLKTNGMQRPWINESLRRLLYFGRAPTELAGDEGSILKERRQLLLTIAALPEADRKQVESVATDVGVPMDALYGMLKALGQDMPADPAELDRVLREQSAKVKQMTAERQALTSTDPEIVRLSGLADAALNEGALSTAIALRERAKSRVGELEKTIGSAEASLRARRIEFAEVYARSAEAYSISFDPLKAAQDYQRAFEEVRMWDSALAAGYRNHRIGALIAQGDFKGDNGALKQALKESQEVIRNDDIGSSVPAALAVRSNMALALFVLGKRESDSARLQESADLYRQMLSDYGGVITPVDRVTIQASLGDVLLSLGERLSDPANLQQAIDAFDAALRVAPKSDPVRWASLKIRQGNASWLLGYRQQKAGPLLVAASTYREVLARINRDSWPLAWADAQGNLGGALEMLGEIEQKPEWLRQALVAHGEALALRSRERTPLAWAAIQSNIGRTLHVLGKQESNPAIVEQAVAAFRLALEEQTKDRAPFIWARTQNLLAQALVTISTHDTSAAPLQDAVAAYRAALTEITRDRIPEQWVITQNNLANTLALLGQREPGVQSFAEAVAAYRQVLEVYTRDRAPADWTAAQINLATALRLQGQREKGFEHLGEAISAYQEVLTASPREQNPIQWARLTDSIGETQIDIADRTKSRAMLGRGIKTIEASWEAFQAAGQTQNDAYFADRLSKLRARFAQMR